MHKLKRKLRKLKEKGKERAGSKKKEKREKETKKSSSTRKKSKKKEEATDDDDDVDVRVDESAADQQHQGEFHVWMVLLSTCCFTYICISS
jgi:hypothetical protein